MLRVQHCRKVNASYFHVVEQAPLLIFTFAGRSVVAALAAVSVVVDDGLELELAQRKKAVRAAT